MQKQMRWCVVLMFVVLSIGCDPRSPDRPGDKPNQTFGGVVTGPITGGSKGGPAMAAEFDLEPHGYVEEEFFLEGNATAYTAQGKLGLDGLWGAVPTEKAPYKTRLLVRRPADPNRFNGTVVVEWLNVTGGVDVDPCFAYAWEELLRGGYGYVGVSLQEAGVNGANGAAIPLETEEGALPLTQWDSERYSSLHHPGDRFGYDILTQAGNAISRSGKIFPAQGPKVERLIAYGQSQSAMRLITYVNAIQPLANVFDGFFIQSRAQWGAPVGDESGPLVGNGKPVHVRENIDARVLQFVTESELFIPMGPFFNARQPDNDHLRTWEVAGTAHVDQHVFDDEQLLPGCGLVDMLANVGGDGEKNNGPAHIVVKAGIRAMHLWLQDGKAPAHGDPLAVNARKNAIARDAYGNALGGVRTPAVDAPIATLNGTAMDNPRLIDILAVMGGKTIPFTSSQLQELYPTHQDYVDKVTAAAGTARKAGFILPEEEAGIIAEAIDAPIP